MRDGRTNVTLLLVVHDDAAIPAVLMLARSGLTHQVARRHFSC